MRTPVLVLFVLAGTAATSFGQSAGESFETPRFQLALSGGTTLFRGGEETGGIRFQPDMDATTAGAALAFRLARFVALEAAGDLTWGKEDEDGFQGPDNSFVTAGLKFPFTRGRLVPYLSLGGGLVNRSPGDEFEEIVEDAFELDQTDPLAYAGGGLEFRLTRLFGLRGDYRYLRIFPEGVEDLDLERESFGAHKITGGLTLSF